MKKLVCVFLLLLTACGTPKQQKVEKKQDVFYEIFVASFNDSNNDGIGDLNGITQKLDYLDELGISGIWLMPIHPSETYHKYDVDDYYAIDKSYGTMQDFETLIAEAKKRNIKIIIDLVLNHTSDTHPWFMDAKNRENCKYCDYYHFSNELKPKYAKLNDNLYYEADFWEEMPDLNVDNTKVREEIKNIAKFWLDKGVSGFRLDAIAHFSDTTEKTFDFLSWFMKEVKTMKNDAFVVGEAWKDEITVLNYYHTKIDALFDFSGSELAGRIVKHAFQQQGQKLAEETVAYNNKIKEISQSSVNAPFISNHDQARSAGYLNDDLDKKLIASIYLLSPGTPFIYYGEEIGMKGSGKDENKRLALTWGESKDAKSPKNADYHSTHKQTIKEALQDNQSLLNHYKKVIRFKHLYTDKKIPKSLPLHENLFALQYENYKIIINTGENAVLIDKIGEVIDFIEKPKVDNKIEITKGNVIILK